MEIMTLLDKIEETLANSPRVPLTGKILIDPEEVLALLDEMRSVMPEEIRAAQRVVHDSERILGEAKAQSDALIREARAYAMQIAGEHQITQEAQKQAQEMLEKATKQSHEMIDQAKRVAREIRTGAREYADDLLAKVEKNLATALQAIQGARQELR
jgi:cell division septum initiation protein DivIVA